MAKVTRKVNVYLNSNKVDEVSLIEYLDNYNGSTSSLFKLALREHMKNKKNDEVKLKPITTAVQKSSKASKTLLNTFTL
ncbi:MAG: hypothetical protein ACI92O_000488 [Colwellia sp.]|jgi:hypothetical protein